MKRLTILDTLKLARRDSAIKTHARNKQADATYRAIRECLDAVSAMPRFRGDDNGIFVRHLVRETLAEIFRFERIETKWANGQLIKIMPNVNEGAREFGWQELEHVGKAKIIADGATDIPKSELAGDFHLRPVKTVAIAFEYSTQDIRTAKMQGTFDIVTEKAAAAREGYDIAIDELILFGSAAHSLNGVVHHPGMQSMEADTPNWQTASAADIVNSFGLAVRQYRTTTDGIETPDSALFDLETFSRIEVLQNSAASDITVLEFLKRTYPMIKTWDWDINMRKAGPSATASVDDPSVLLYRNDPTRIRAVMPMRLVPLPPEAKGLSFEVVMESRFGGVMAPRPRSLMRIDSVGA